ncbi:PPM1N isoform 2 [Pongo abelii]|uniref:protein-serine/threonine phosphatase n=1 Tax=Pongo abelii TaxID=9601 RepID=A0A2J8U6H2_PONAB|nr:PPM1N isoform 2 [Pongo abelii]
MTCILVCFPGAPRPSEEAIRRELALDAALGRRIAELCASAQEPPSLNTVFRTLASEDIPDLPPGGGLDCKRGRMGLGSPPPRIWAQPWTRRADSCCPLGILCFSGASTELKKKTDPFPSYMYQRKEGRPM